ncbi:hypothetical protein R3P38DRAFT_3101787 [Favolaschia claudopus]|uniref:Uncharacterized protein n=1 Tax=Favolaschia claudopus TaxID=2862362 RepID=A0AAV9ZMF9_9AGAR
MVYFGGGIGGAGGEGGKVGGQGGEGGGTDFRYLADLESDDIPSSKGKDRRAFISADGGRGGAGGKGGLKAGDGGLGQGVSIPKFKPEVLDAVFDKVLGGVGGDGGKTTLDGQAGRGGYGQPTQFSGDVPIPSGRAASEISFDELRLGPVGALTEILLRLGVGVVKALLDRVKNLIPSLLEGDVQGAERLVAVNATMPDHACESSGGEGERMAIAKV